MSFKAKANAGTSARHCCAGSTSAYCRCRAGLLRHTNRRSNFRCLRCWTWSTCASSTARTIAKPSLRWWKRTRRATTRSILRLETPHGIPYCLRRSPNFGRLAQLPAVSAEILSMRRTNWPGGPLSSGGRMCGSIARTAPTGASWMSVGWKRSSSKLVKIAPPAPRMRPVRGIAHHASVQIQRAVSHQPGPRSPSACLVVPTSARASRSASASPALIALPTPRWARISRSTSAWRWSGASAGLLMRHRRPCTTKSRPSGVDGMRALFRSARLSLSAGMSGHALARTRAGDAKHVKALVESRGGASPSRPMACCRWGGR